MVFKNLFNQDKINDVELSPEDRKEFKDIIKETIDDLYMSDRIEDVTPLLINYMADNNTMDLITRQMLVKLIEKIVHEIKQEKENV